VFSSIDPVFAAARGAAMFERFCSKMERERPDDCIPDLKPRMQGVVEIGIASKFDELDVFSSEKGHVRF
jgi:hypothetical protein